MVGGSMLDRFDAIAKQRLNIILLVDVSSSMRGRRIDQVNLAIEDIIKYLKGFEAECSNVDFYMSILTFGTEAKWELDEKAKLIDNISFSPIKAKGYSNLHLAYNELAQALDKEHNGGIMPDFGGVAPIILLLTDGHPTKLPLKKELEELQKKP